MRAWTRFEALATVAVLASSGFFAAGSLGGCNDETKKVPAPASASAPGAPLASAEAPAPLAEKLHERTVLARLHKPRSIVLEAGSAYVTDAIGGDKASNEILDVVRVPLGGGEPTRLAKSQRINGALLVGKGDLFFTSISDVKGEDRISKIPIGRGGGPATVATRAMIQADPALATDGTSLFYFSLPAGADEKHADVMRAPIAGGKATKIASADRTVRVLFIAADKENVYWPEPGRLVKAPVTGGAVTEIAKVVYAWAAASDGMHLYRTDSPGESMGAIMRVPIAGGSPESLATGFSFPVALAVDAKSVYFVNFDAEDGAVLRVPKTGGTVTTLVTGQKHPSRLAIDDKSVYWISVGEGTVCKADK